MDSFLTYICHHASDAYWIIFVLLLLAGLNIPISEDVLLITGGVLASTCISDQTLFLYGWILAGCILSAWEAYWIGRKFGHNLYRVPWFNRFINKEKIDRLHHYYEKFGIFTFIVGRFIPGGVRNTLFMTAGMGKMPFLKFILRDAVGCVISTAVIFYAGYAVGENYHLLIHSYKRYQLSVIILIVAGVIGLFLYRLKKNK